MDEFLGSVQYNKRGDLLVSSSYLTFQRWTGFIGVLTSDEFTKRPESPLMLSTLRLKKSINSGLSSAKWVSNDSVLIGTDLGLVDLYNLTDDGFDLTMSKHEHDSLVSCLDVDSNTAISGSHDSRIKIWDLNEKISTRTYRGHDFSVNSVDFKPNESKVFLSTAQDNRAVLWDLRKDVPAVNLKHGLSGYPSCGAWSLKDSNMVVLGSEIGELGVYDLRSMSKVLIRRVHDRLIRQIKLNDLNLISSASEDCTTKVSQTDLKTIYVSKHKDYVTGLDWKNNLEYVTCSWDGFVKHHQVNFKIQNGH